MRLNLIGTDDGFIGNGLFDEDGFVDVDVISPRNVLTDTVVVENATTGYLTTFTGVNLFISSDGNPTQGTITGISFADETGTEQGSITSINWNFLTFLQAILALESDDLQPIANLFNASGPITVDGSAAQAFFDFEDGFQDLSPLLTADITFLGTGFEGDRFQGGLGDDSVQSGAWGVGIDATPGDDTVDFGGISEDYAWSWVDYDDFRVAATISIDSDANTGSVLVDGNTHSFIDVLTALEADGLAVSGTTADDTFNLNIGTNSADGGRLYFQATPLEGNDTLNLSGDGHVRISYNWSEFGILNGISVDLSTGVVSDDGTGGTDQINVLSGNLKLEIQATDFADTLLGSDRNENFIPEQGNDTIDGAEGWDAVRYDRSGVGPVFVDLGANIATGTWDGNGFTDTLFNIEEVRGSREGDDTLIGDDGNNLLVGRGGNDSIDGAGGDDTVGLWNATEADATITYLGDGSFEIVTNEGADTVTNVEYAAFADGEVALTIPGDLIEGSNDPETLEGGQADDTITAGRGDDSVDGGDGNDDIYGDGGMDTLVGGAGDDTIRGGREADTIYGGDGADVIRSQRAGDIIWGGDGDDNIKGGGGNDTIYGEGGHDFLKGGARKDLVYGGGGDDKLLGNSFDDTLIGGAGNDTLKAGGENDILDGGAGDDFLKGGTGNDVFVFDANHGSDVIADFDDGDNMLQISSALAGGLDAQGIENAAYVQGGSVFIDFGNGDLIELDGITDTAGLAAQIDIV